MPALPSATLTPLWDDFSYKTHQVTGVTWMMERENCKSGGPRGGILCDEMGLGKTIQMLGLILNNCVSDTEDSLLVLPVAVIQQWRVAAARAGMTVCMPKAVGLSRSWDVVEIGEEGRPNIFLIGYEMLQRHPGFGTTTHWKRVIYDEAHRIASGNESTKIAMKLKADHKWMLTATPIVNKVADLRVLLAAIGCKVPKTNILTVLRPFFSRYVMARTMEQLRASMPDAPPAPVSEDVVLDFTTKEEEDFYHEMAQPLEDRFMKLKNGSGGRNMIEMLKLLMRLRQLSLHPQVYIASRRRAVAKVGGSYTKPDWTASSTKFQTICKMVSEDPTGRWIVFCHFHQEMEMLAEELRAVPTVERVQCYSGAISHAEKEEVLAATKEPLPAGRGEVLLVQLQSGGVGLNLQHFNRVLFSGPWWTKALMDQAVGRAVRIGQRDVVKVYHLRLREEAALNIDELMHGKAAAKGELCSTVLKTALTAVTMVQLREQEAEREAAAVAAALAREEQLRALEASFAAMRQRFARPVVAAQQVHDSDSEAEDPIAVVA